MLKLMNKLIFRLHLDAWPMLKLMNKLIFTVAPWR